MTLDYYYRDQAEQFFFYRIPKVLFTDKRFKDFSVAVLEVPYIKSRDAFEQLLQALEDEYGLTVTITETRD